MTSWNGATEEDYSKYAPVGNLSYEALRTKNGLQGTGPFVAQTATPAAATDAATTQALVNDLRTKLIALGIVS
jgi:hypothetical protein